MYCAYILTYPCTCYGCHTNTEVRFCSIHMQLYMISACIHPLHLRAPVYSMILQEQNPVAESQAGSWQGTRSESQSGWKLGSTPLISSSPFSLFHPTQLPPFNPDVPLLFTLSLSLCPVFISAHPCPFICPLFFPPCVGKHKLLYVCHRGVNMWPGRLGGSRIISAYRTKFNLH